METSGLLHAIERGTAWVFGSLERAEVSKISGRILERERSRCLWLIN